MKNNAPDEIMSLFFSSFRSLKQKLDMGNPIYHLPFAQVETLRFIGEKKQATMKETSDLLAITPPSTTVLVGNLVKLGFVLRTSDKKDRRNVHLRLTKKGGEILQKTINQRCKVFTKLLGNLSPKEQLEFINILKKMASN